MRDRAVTGTGRYRAYWRDPPEADGKRPVLREARFEDEREAQKFAGNLLISGHLEAESWEFGHEE